MTKGPDPSVLRGEECARSNGFDQFPVDPFAIAARADIDVTPKPAKPGVSGMLIRVGEAFAIAYSTNVNNVGFQRFSVGHELGHYFLADHAFQVFGDDGIHESRAGFSSENRYEREADLFAVGLLMPRSLFTPALSNAGEGLAAIEHMASTCNTSLVATALRLTELTRDSIGVVVTRQDEVEFVAFSDKFRELKFDWPKRRDAIPRGTLTVRFNGDPSRIVQADRDESETELATWFTTHGRNVRIFEEVIGLGTYGRTLTVLTPLEEMDEEEAEEEEALMRSWTPTLSRSRRR